MSVGGKKNLRRQTEEAAEKKAEELRVAIVDDENFKDLSEEEQAAVLQAAFGPNRKDRRAQQSMTLESIVNKSGQKAVAAYKKKARARKLRKTHKRSVKT